MFSQGIQKLISLKSVFYVQEKKETLTVVNLNQLCLKILERKKVSSVVLIISARGEDKD